MTSQAQILVVEDEENWQDLLSTLLSSRGYGVRVAASYGEARARLQHQIFDVAVVDLRLSYSLNPQNLHGRLVLIRAHESAMPAIVISAVATPELVDEACEVYDICDFFDKSGFDEERFLASVEQAISGVPPATGRERPAQSSQASTHVGADQQRLAERRRSLHRLARQYYDRADEAIAKREVDQSAFEVAVTEGKFDATAARSLHAKAARCRAKLSTECQLLLDRIDGAKTVTELDSLETQVSQKGTEWMTLF